MIKVSGYQGGRLQPQTNNGEASMKNDQTWSALERTYADQDNRRFDLERRKRRQRRDNRLVTIGLSVGVLLSVGVVFYLFGVILFKSMPLPETTYDTHARDDLAQLVQAFR
jgi:hypothetical protein